MTAGDIPDWTGQPDQGFEGYRFVGFNLYDGLLNWDCRKPASRCGSNPDSRPNGTSIRMTTNAGSLELRPGVKFHDGCAWNADVALWNFERLMSDKSPAFSPANFARARSRTNDIDHVEKVDDMTIAIYTKQVTLAVSLQSAVRPDDVEMRAGEGRQRLQGLRQRAVRNRPLQVRQGGAARAARAGEEPGLLGPQPRSQARPGRAAADAGGDDPRRRAAERPGRYRSRRRRPT